jgi:hypothetical protein
LFADRWTDSRASALGNERIQMALIHRGSRCAICRTPLDRPYTATSGCAFPPEHELFAFCDAGLHLDCLAAWPQRIQFARGYCDRGRSNFQHGHGALLHEGATWLLGCGPLLTEGSAALKLPNAHVGEPFFAEVVLAQWPLSLRSPWREWTEHLEQGFRADLPPPARADASAALDEVRGVAPTLAALMSLLPPR